MRHGVSLECALLFVLASTIAAAQQPAPHKMHVAPLARPEALVSVSSSDPVKLLKAVQQKIAATGFQIVRVDLPAGMLEAKRADCDSCADYDKVLLWLERDLREPTKFIKLYVLYGRYEEIWAARRDVYRVVVDDAFESNRTKPIRNALLALATEAGEPQ